MALNPQIPKTLYKYRPIKKCEDILTKMEIWFSEPKKFNDPFDCSIQIRFDKLSKEEFDNQGIDLLKHLAPQLTIERAQEVIAELRKEGIARPHNLVSNFNQQQLEQLQENVRVFCLSQEKNDILLWSHYGDSHSGVCIGFNTDILYKNTGAGIGKIVYMADYPEVKPSGVGNMQDLIIQVCTKPKEWSYEKEFRFVFWEPKNSFSISPEVIEDITFGCKATDADIEKVRSIVSLNKALSHVKFYRARKHSSQFLIEIDPLEK